jgi:hypothetical protein
LEEEQQRLREEWYKKNDGLLRSIQRYEQESKLIEQKHKQHLESEVYYFSDEEDRAVNEVSDIERKDMIRYDETNLTSESNLARKGFSDSTKERVLSNQRHRCASCKSILVTLDFDHIDGNRSNNDISNCQALCPSCHALKTRNRNYT